MSAPPSTAAAPALLLIGLRGSGKSTLGRLLAAVLTSSFIDFDDRTRARTGHASVSAAFTAIGEAAFRAAETRALQETLAQAGPGTVIALGGGTPTAPGARAVLEDARAAGRVRIALLEAPPAVLGARLSVTPGDRPLLMGSNFAEEAALLAQRRMPLYRALADATIDTSRPTEVALADLLAFARRGA